MKNKPDYVLILAAGKGTRMGNIGQVLPKVLWPIFNRSLLELQVLYAKSLGLNKIFINTHFHEKQILQHVQSTPAFKDVEILSEENILDVGGAIHNLARKVSYQGTLLVVNADQFFMLDQRINRACEKLKEVDCVLFTTPVETKYGYNTLEVEKGLLKKIIDKSEHTENSIQQTYTGVSLIKLSSLMPTNGSSKFFETVANYSKVKVACFEREDEEYWDFGTLRRYLDSAKKLIREIHSESNFTSFIKTNCETLEGVNPKSFKFGSIKVESNHIEYMGIKDFL